MHCQGIQGETCTVFYLQLLLICNKKFTEISNVLCKFHRELLKVELMELKYLRYDSLKYTDIVSCNVVVERLTG